MPEEIEIKAGEGIVEIAGIHTENSSSKKKGVTRATSKQMNFYRPFRLPDSVDTEKMDVKLESGKFTVRLPRTLH
ncbi:MAG TPA: Hsp20/alpha crystallin family protein [Acidiferrobacteraceae bacterium]|nr:Hsp20/alpha crystallin family protein [Acidiferrobacteraceae bacterium]HEX19962.1 Hsp20/alpha crystallin family protein [Acidiferrobacteraceae bacterium]